MIKLGQEHYEKVMPLLESVPFNTLSAQSVMRQMVGGQIYVDDLQAPTASFIIHSYGMSTLCGNCQNPQFNQAFIQFLKNSSSHLFPVKWLFAYPDGWQQVLTALWGPKLYPLHDDQVQGIAQAYPTDRVLLTQRINFKFMPELYAKSPSIPPGFTLKKIDHNLYDQIHGSVIPQRFWNNPAEFLERSIGFGLLYGEEWVSTCFAAFIIGNQVELGVETAARFRKKGYAAYAAAAMIEHCLTHGFEPVWSCTETNLGSFHLAEKIGFSPLSTHPYYCIPCS